MTEQKKRRGQPRHYEANKQRRNLRITDTAWDSFGIAAKKAGISRSELIERLGRKGEAWLIDAAKESHIGSTTEEQIKKNQPAMEWARKRMEEIKATSVNNGIPADKQNP